MSQISDALAAAAAGPKSTTIDGQTTVEHSLRELIEADVYLAETTASTRTKLPLRLAKVRNGGPVL